MRENKFISFIFVCFAILLVTHSPVFADDILGDLNVTGEITAGTITVETVDGDTMAFESMTFDTALIKNLIGDQLNTKNAKIENPVHVLLKNKNNDTTAQITEDGRIKTSTDFDKNIKIDTPIERILDAQGDEIDFDKNNRLRVTVEGKNPKVDALSDDERKFFEWEYDTITQTIFDVVQEVKKEQPRYITNFDTDITVVEREWSLDPSEDKVEAEVTNNVKRDWVLTPSSDTVNAIVKNFNEQDTSVIIEDENINIAKSSDVQDAVNKLDEKLTRKTERQWTLDALSDSVSVTNDVLVNLRDSQGDSVETNNNGALLTKEVSPNRILTDQGGRFAEIENNALKVLSIDTGVRSVSRGWTLSSSQDSVTVEGSVKTDTDMLIVDQDGDIVDIDGSSLKVREQNRNRIIEDKQGDKIDINRGSLLVRLSNQDTDVSIVSSVPLDRAWDLDGSQDSVKIQGEVNTDTNTQIVDQDGDKVLVDSNALQVKEINPENMIVDSSGDKAEVTNQALDVNVRDRDDTESVIVGAEGQKIGNDSDALKIYEVAPQRSLFGSQTGEPINATNNSLDVNLTNSDSVSISDSVDVKVLNESALKERLWNLNASEDSVAVQGDFSSDTDVQLVGDNAETVGVTANALDVNVQNQSGQDTSVEIVKSIPFKRDWSLSSGNDSVTVSGEVLVDTNTILVNKNGEVIGDDDTNPIVTRLTSSDVQSLKERTWSLTSAEDSVAVSGIVESQSTIVGATDGTEIGNTGSALNVYNDNTDRSIVDSTTGEPVTVDNSALLTELNDTTVNNLLNRSWSLNASEDSVTITGDVTSDTDVVLNVVDDTGNEVQLKGTNGKLEVISKQDTTYDVRQTEPVKRDWNLQAGSDSVEVSGKVKTDTKTQIIDEDGDTVGVIENSLRTYSVAPQRSIIDDKTGEYAKVEDHSLLTNINDTDVAAMKGRTWDLDSDVDEVEVTGDIQTDTSVQIVSRSGTPAKFVDEGLAIYEVAPQRSIFGEVSGYYAQVKKDNSLKTNLNDTTVNSLRGRDWSLDSSTDSVSVEGEITGTVETDSEVTLVNQNGQSAMKDNAVRVFDPDTSTKIIGSNGQTVDVSSNRMLVSLSSSQLDELKDRSWNLSSGSDTVDAFVRQEGFWEVAQAGAWEFAQTNQDTDVTITNANEVGVDTDALVMGETSEGTHIKGLVTAEGKFITQAEQKGTWTTDRSWSLSDTMDSVSVSIDPNDEIISKQADNDSYTVNIDKADKDEFYSNSFSLNSGDTVAINFGGTATEYIITPMGGNIYWSSQDNQPTTSNDPIINNSKWVEDSDFTNEIYVKAGSSSVTVHVRALK